MDYGTPELLSDALCIVGEGPIWDDNNDRLLMVDIQGKRLRSIDWSSGKATDTVLPQQTGFVFLGCDGEIFGGAEDGIYKISEDGLFTRFSKPFVVKGERLNDGKTGPDGRLYCGSFSRDFSAAFWRIEPDGKITELFDGVGNSNGLAFDNERKLMYYNDTPTRRTDVFDFDSESGRLFNRRTVCTYSSGSPDGMTIDTDGNLWVALWGSSTVVCVCPTDGKIIKTIRVPASQTACCSFAGKDLKTLVITTAAHGIALRNEPLAGATFAINTDVCGVPTYRFKRR